MKAPYGDHEQPFRRTTTRPDVRTGGSAFQAAASDDHHVACHGDIYCRGESVPSRVMLQTFPTIGGKVFHRTDNEKEAVSARGAGATSAEKTWLTGSYFTKCTVPLVTVTTGNASEYP